MISIKELDKTNSPFYGPVKNSSAKIPTWKVGIFFWPDNEIYLFLNNIFNFEKGEFYLVVNNNIMYKLKKRYSGGYYFYEMMKKLVVIIY